MMLFHASKFSILLLSGVLLTADSAVAQAPAAQAEAAQAGAATADGAAQDDAGAAGEAESALVEKVGLVMGHNMATNFKAQNPDADVAEIVKGIKAAETDQLKQSFLFGYQMMSRIKSQNAGITAAQLEVGMNKVIAGKPLGISEEETQMLMMSFSRMMERKKAAELKAKSDANDAEGKAYIQQQVSSNANLKELSDGIYYEVLAAGEGESPSPSSRVKVDYKGTLTNGEVFDTSLEPSGGRPAAPAVFPVSGVIPGFSKALQAMKVGGKWRVLIPGEQAYGVRGSGQKIGPMQTLIFELSLLEIVEPPKPPKSATGDAPGKADTATDATGEASANE